MVHASGNTTEVKQLSKNKDDINQLNQFTGLSQLHYAARAGNNDEIDVICQNNGDVNRLSLGGGTPLHLACKYNKPDTVRKLINNGAKLNVAGKFGRTPLHVCADKGHVDCMTALLAMEKIDINLSDNLIDPKESGMTPLHLAVSNADIKCVELLLASGANVTAKNSKQQTPLHLACCTGSRDHVKLLIQHNSEKDSQDIDGATPLLHACYHDQKEIVTYLCQLYRSEDDRKNMLEHRTNSGETALYWAAAGGWTDIVDILIANGADVKTCTDANRSALHAAARNGKEDTCEHLIVRGCNKEAEDKLGLSPLALAARYGQCTVVKYLIDAKADINSLDYSGASPLFHAVQENKAEVTEWLVKKMSEETINYLDHQDHACNTPLHIAAEKGYPFCLKILLEANCSMAIKNKQGLTAAHLAAANGRIETMEKLIKKNNTCVNDQDDMFGDQPLHFAAKHGYVQICRQLLEGDAQVNKSNNQGVTPLHMAAECGGSMVCDVLIDKEAVINAIDNNKDTPLHYATRAGDEETTSLLVKYGAQLHTLNQLNKNALLTAIMSNNPNCVSAILNCPNWEDSFQDSSILHELIIHFPDHAQSVFDKCTKVDGDISSESNDFQVTFNYSLLEGQKTHPWSTMLEHNRIQLLDHPLVSSLLTDKWCGYGLLLYCSNLLLYICYLVMITWYCLLELPPNAATGKERSSTILTGLAGAVVGFSVIRLILEFAESLKDFSSYIRSFTNYIEVILYILSIVFVSNSFYSEPGRSRWHWEIGCFTILFAWLCLALFLRKVPNFGSQVIMFTTVFKSFIRILPFILVFLIAFGLAFYMCLRNQPIGPPGSFMTAGYSILKSIMIFMGEVNMDVYFVPYQLNDENPVNYPYATYTIFPLFVICMPLLLMNLLVGLAVDDISVVLGAAKLQRKAKRVEAISTAETFCTQFNAQGDTSTTTKTVFPNKTWYFGYPYEFRGSHVEEILKRQKHGDDTKTHVANNILSTLSQINEGLAVLSKAIVTKDDMEDVKSGHNIRRSECADQHWLNTSMDRIQSIISK